MGHRLPGRPAARRARRRRRARSSPSRCTERKRIQIVDYRGSKALTTTTIEEELKKRRPRSRSTPSTTSPRRAGWRRSSREMLAEKGRPFATVKHDAKSVGGAGHAGLLRHRRRPQGQGQGDRVRRATASSPTASCAAQMKKIKQTGFWNLTWLGRQDHLHRGEVGGPAGGRPAPAGGLLPEPRLRHRQRRRAARSPTSTGKTGEEAGQVASQLEIPVTEGEQYRVGEVKFEGLTVFKEEGIRPLFKLETGDVYKESRIKKGYDKLRDVYGGQGYFQWTGAHGAQARPRAEGRGRDPGHGGGQAVLRRAGSRFTGNDTTRDKVIRREVYLNEGDVFNTEALKLSIRRINQLGYFKPMEGAPELEPERPRRGQARRHLQGRGAEPQPVHLRRRGQRPGGDVHQRVASRPRTSWAWARPSRSRPRAAAAPRTTRSRSPSPTSSTGPSPPASTSSSGKLDLRDLRRTWSGYTAGAHGRQPGDRPARWGASRASSPTTRTRSSTSRAWTTLLGIDPTTPTRRPAQPVFDPFFFGEEGRRRESRLTPVARPQHGGQPVHAAQRHEAHRPRSQLAGGPLGRHGELLQARRWRSIFYIPHTAQDRARPARGRLRRTITARIGDTAELLPYYQRFFLGGETQIRGVNIRTVGPVDASNRALGGNKFVLFNAEYYFDIGGPAARAALLRRRPGLPGGREDRPQGAPHLDGRRAALHHARPQRALPAHLRLEPEP